MATGRPLELPRARPAMLPLLLSLGVLASASGGRSCARGAAAGAGGACAADEGEEASHLQVRGSVREAGSSIGLGAADVERVSDISPSAARRARRSRARGGGPKTQVIAEHDAEYFQQGYGQLEWSWFTGVVVTDTVSLAGVSAEGQRFGLVQMGNMPIGNAYPDDGPSSDDGIMGLLPGCLKPDSAACKKSENATDVIANLYFSGSLSEYAFTICLHDSEEGGGMMWLGASSSPLPEGSVEVPLQFDYYYQLVPPAGEPDIPFYFGAPEPLFTVGAGEYDTLFANGLIDSGTNGLGMPPYAFNQTWGALVSIWQADSDIAEILPEVEKSWFAEEAVAVAIPSEIAQKMSRLVPDLIFALGDANVSVLGSSLMYQTTPCSGEYAAAWYPNSDNSWGLGSAFFYGRTLRFDLTVKTGFHTATGTLTMIPDDKCEANYGEHGQGTAVSGVPGQVLGVGTMTAVVSLGEPPQDFVVQLDTGSQDLMVYQDTCMLVGLGAYEGCLVVLGEPPLFEVVLGAQPPDAPAYLSPPECSAYLSSMMEALGLNDSLPQSVWAPIPVINSVISKYLKPWQKCDGDRIFCGTGADFNTSASQSLEPKNFPQFVFAQDPPPGSGEVECQLCNSSA